MPKYAYFGINIHSNFFYRCLRDVLSTGNAESQLPPKGVGVGFIHTSKKFFRFLNPNPNPNPSKKNQTNHNPNINSIAEVKSYFFIIFVFEIFFITNKISNIKIIYLRFFNLQTKCQMVGLPCLS